MLDAVLARCDENLEASLERLYALIRIPSISTDPAHDADCDATAEVCADTLRGIGFDASVRPTPGRAMVVGHRTDAAVTGPSVLFYGHYDVQPVDPVELWNTPPFEPTIVTRPDGSKMIVARGSSDDKGQLLTFVEACRAWIEVTGGLPVPVSILFEGEEESGSPSLNDFLDANRAELSKDLALVCDTSMWNADTPAISIGLRGLVGEEIEISAANKDLHSGHFGGPARNPNHVLAAIIAALHDADGRVTVPGFYAGVHETPAEVKAQWESMDFTSESFLGPIGLSLPAGERGRSIAEMVWARPTCEVNGMIGGYTGAGFKTVIPAKASAKISFRLVGDQDPVAIREAFRRFVTERVPEDCSVAFHAHGGSPAITIPADLTALSQGRKALAEEWGKDALLIGMGGSIPIVGEFKRRLGMDTLLVGFALDDDAIHSPNEKYELKSFHKGIRSWARILGELAA